MVTFEISKKTERLNVILFLMKYKWQIQEAENISKDFLEIAYGSEIIAKLLLNRGINTTEKAKSYLNPKFYTESKPEEIPDLLKAKDRIIEAIKNNEKITIFGDYDVDGTTATSCLLITLREFTQNLDFYIPNRLTEGYGLNPEAVKTIAKKNKKACHGKPLLITCDCGITNQKEIELANELGMDVIVTDHHSLPEILPPAYAVLNPKQLPSDHRLHWLPGVGVAYKLAEAILEEQTLHIIDKNRKIIKEDLLDLVTLGMIADLAPLVDENRYLVQIGLPKLAATKKVGLQELLRICGLSKEERGNKPTTEHIGFGIAPRINAVGRLTDGALAVKLMTTNDLLEAIQISTELDFQNKQRQTLCEEILKEAISRQKEAVSSDKCIVLAKEGWHHGVIGIVASRVVEKFHLPTILIAIDKEMNIARGSGRSSGELNITEALSGCSEYLEKFGGHKAACGLSIKLENIPDFISAFKTLVNKHLADANMEPVLKIDAALPLSNLDKNLIDKIYMLSPFGLGNSLPVFSSKETLITGIKSIGKNNQHLKLMLRDDTKCFEALIWNYENNFAFNLGDKIKAAYTPKLNHFNGETFIQLEVKDWEILNRMGVSVYGDMSREEKSVQEIEIHDFRKRTQEYLKQFKEQSVIYFAETTQKDFLPLKTASRTKLSESEILVLLESPPDETLFLEIIKAVNPKKIHAALAQPSLSSPQSFLSKLTGLLKYVESNKNSKTDEIDLQSVLGVNKSTLAYGLEVLAKTGFLNYKREGNELSVNLSTPSRQNFTQLIEYELLTSELKKLFKFRNWLFEEPIEKITAFLNQNDIKAKVALKEKVEVLL